MTITHILSDGTTLSDISGKVVKKEEAPEVYKIIEKIRRTNQ